MTLRAAVVGAGPSGLQATRILLAHGVDEIVLHDRSGSPFGLARTGVAPDHQNGQNAITELTPVLDDPRVRLVSGTFGDGLDRADLAASFDLVVYAMGCPTPRRLDVPGADLPGVYLAPELYDWYNDVPSADRIDLSGVHDVVVVGAGDTANDMARVLLYPDEMLPTVRITAAVADQLRGIRPRVTMAIRGSAAQNRFKPRDLPGLVGLPGVQVSLRGFEMPTDHDLDPAVLRSAEILATAAQGHPSAPVSSLDVCFHTHVVQIQGSGRVESVVLDGPDGRRTVPAQLVVAALGFQQPSPWAGLPFDEATGVIPSLDFHVLDGDTPAPREFVVGWARRGATGGFGTCRREADEFATALASALA